MNNYDELAQDLLKIKHESNNHQFVELEKLFQLKMKKKYCKEYLESIVEEYYMRPKPHATKYDLLQQIYYSNVFFVIL
jgi:hypothetical protein